MSEQRDVHFALRQLGFAGVSPMDWIFRSRGVTCAVPHEETNTFSQAIRFLREGAFQSDLQKQTRLTYYHLSEMLELWCLSQTKGIHVRSDQAHHQRLS